MTRKKEAAAKARLPRPPGGGSYMRDPKTGALTRVLDAAATAPDPGEDAATTETQKG